MFEVTIRTDNQAALQKVMEFLASLDMQMFKGEKAQGKKYKIEFPEVAPSIPTKDAGKIEITINLYEKGILSFGQARKLAGLGYFEFEKLLFDRKVPSGYTPEDLEADFDTLQQLHNKR